MSRRDVGAHQNVLLPLFVLQMCYRYVQHFCSAIVAFQLLRCNCCRAFVAVPLLHRNCCSLVVALQLLHCNCCSLVVAVQCAVPNAVVLEHESLYIFVL